MKKLLFILTVICFAPFNHGELGYLASQGKYEAKVAGQAAKDAQSNQGAATNVITRTVSTAACPTGSSCQTITSTTSMPDITVSLLDVNNSPLKGSSYTFPSGSITNTNALLTVHIFPPSNVVATTAVTAITADPSYYVVYTLKSLDGITLQKKVLPTPPISPATAAATPLTFSNFPASVSISSGGSTLITSTFLSANFSKNLNAVQQQQVFNGICPLSQKFLITQSSGTISSSGVTSISGKFDTGNSVISSLTLPAAPSSAGTANTQPITITILDNGGNVLQAFTFKATSFTQADLANGLAAIVHSFPPSGSSGNYLFVATLKTLDGLKLQKKAISVASSGALPSAISISSGSSTLISDFLNTTATSQVFNMESPMGLKYLVQKPTGGKTMISMF